MVMGSIDSFSGQAAISLTEQHFCMGFRSAYSSRSPFANDKLLYKDIAKP